MLLLPLSFSTDFSHGPFVLSPSEMLQIYKDLDLAIPEDVEVAINSREIHVKGPRGELHKVSTSFVDHFDAVMRKRGRQRGTMKDSAIEGKDVKEESEAA